MRTELAMSVGCTKESVGGSLPKSISLYVLAGCMLNEIFQISNHIHLVQDKFDNKFTA